MFTDDWVKMHFKIKSLEQQLQQIQNELKQIKGN